MIIKTKEEYNLGIIRRFILATPDAVYGHGLYQIHLVVELIIGFRIHRVRPVQHANNASASPNGAIIVETVVKYFVPNVVALNRTSNTWKSVNQYVYVNRVFWNWKALILGKLVERAVLLLLIIIIVIISL